MDLIWTLVAPWLHKTDLAAARLACRDLAAAVDGSSNNSITSLRVPFTASLPPHAPLRLGRSVQHLDAQVSGPQGWPHLLQFLQHLPELRDMRCTGRRTWPPMTTTTNSSSSTEIAAPSCAKLTSISFQGHLTSLQELSALAPNLQALQCHTLILRPTACSSSSSTSSSLQHCRFFDAEEVSITAGDAADAAQAFAAALPALQVLSDTPRFSWHLPTRHWDSDGVMHLQQALSCCTGITAMRVRGVSTRMGGCLPQQLTALQQLRTLSVYRIAPALELLGVSKLTQLTALCLVFELPSTLAAQLMGEVASLCRQGSLHKLAIPAKLLCTKCCRDGPQLFEELLTAWMEAAASSSSSSEAAAGQGSSGSNGGVHGSGSSSSTERRELVLLYRPKIAVGSYQPADFCKHCEPGLLAGRAHFTLDNIRPRPTAAHQLQHHTAPVGGWGSSAAAANPPPSPPPSPPPGVDPEVWAQNEAAMLSDVYEDSLTFAQERAEEQPGPKRCAVFNVGWEGWWDGSKGPPLPFVVTFAELSNAAFVLQQTDDELGGGLEQQQRQQNWAAELQSGCLWGRFGPADWFA